MPSRAQSAAAVVALVLLAPHASARDGQRPSAVAQRIEKPPVIDGRLDDEAWLAADPIGELTQVEPDFGAPPTGRTEVRALYDSEHPYIGVRCFDRDVDGTFGTQMERDAVSDADSSLTSRASRFLTASIEHGYSDIDLPDGSFDTHVGRARTVVSFTRASRGRASCRATTRPIRWV